ncbi:hypothetical protein FPRO04_08112 [Fusarium proliferatum]|nr:hypothetical protein FPRO04_08112 [Fusarium proliferatum]
MNALHPIESEHGDAKKVFDELTEEILNVSDGIFLPVSPIDGQATFTLCEMTVMRNPGSDSFPGEVVICPKACFQDIAIEKPKVLKYRCCCVGEPHADHLTYKHYREIETVSENIRSRGLSTKRVLGLTVGSGTVEMIRKLVITLKNIALPQAIAPGKQGTEDNVDFYFDLREEADLFAAYLKVAQGRMREVFIHGPLENEQIVDSRLLHPDYSQSTQAESWREPPIPAEDDTRAKIRCTLVASKEDGEQRYRAIVSREGYADGVCINFRNRVQQISQRGLMKSLRDLGIWISDYDESGKSIVSQMSWEELTRRGIKSRTLRATFIKSENERTAGDWLDEVDDLIRAMRGDRNDRYERVKIAIIDSGLHDRERSRYRAEYKDFTGVPTNDSWHGTCCAGIIQGMYEEARLYIARVFGRDHADEIEGPLRMARAIHWAIEPPRSVDIISISAGFRNYSKELDDAVTRAKAAGVLVIAAASNWQNTSTVAFPARHNLSTMCIYSTNTGNQGSSFNPEPRADTQNFAILGEGFQHPDQRRNERMSGTSMATSVAAGLAARIVDFSQQKDNKESIFRAQDVGKLPGMLAIFSAMSKPAGSLRYISPLELLPLRHGVSREADRHRVREVISQAMERAN